MAGASIVIDDLRAGDEKTIIVASYFKGTFEPRNITSCTFLIYDPDRPITGTADSGSTTTLTDDALTVYSDDLFNGMVLSTTIGSKNYQSLITDFASSTGTLTFNALPVAVEAGSAYSIPGFPLLPQTTGNASNNEGSLLIGANVTGRPGRRVLIYRADFGTDTEAAVGSFSVLAY